MLSYDVLCYLKRHVQKKPEKQKFDFQNPPRPLPKPLQIHPKSSPRELLGASWGRRHGMSKRWFSTYRVLSQFGGLGSSQTPLKTPPDPSKIESKRALGRLLGPLKTSWAQSLQKRGQKNAKQSPTGSKPPPKSVPKPFPHPPKIDRKTQSKKAYFLEAFFSGFFEISTSKSNNSWIDFRCVLASKFH